MPPSPVTGQAKESPYLTNLSSKYTYLTYLPILSTGIHTIMSSPETRTQPFDMVPESESRQRRGSMVDDAAAGPFGDMREGRRGSNVSDTDQLPLGKGDRRMYESTNLPLKMIYQR